MITMEFIKAGKAIFSVDNGKGEHYTYKIQKHKEKDMWFAYVCISYGVFKYMGVFGEGKVIQGNKGISNDSKSVKVLEWAIRVIKGLSVLPDGYSILHEGRCGRCARPLTDPESIKRGLGPECASKI